MSHVFLVKKMHISLNQILFEIFQILYKSQVQQELALTNFTEVSETFSHSFFFICRDD